MRDATLRSKVHWQGVHRKEDGRWRQERVRTLSLCQVISVPVPAKGVLCPWCNFDLLRCGCATVSGQSSPSVTEVFCRLSHRPKVSRQPTSTPSKFLKIATSYHLCIAACASMKSDGDLMIKVRVRLLTDARRILIPLEAIGSCQGGRHRGDCACASLGCMLYSPLRHQGTFSAPPLAQRFCRRPWQALQYHLTVNHSLDT